MMENEDFQNYMVENEELLSEAEQKIDDFGKVIKSFVLANPNEFVAESVDQMKKNIRVFTEVATSQYITEISSMLAEQLNVSEESVEEGSQADDYF